VPAGLPRDAGPLRLAGVPKLRPAGDERRGLTMLTGRVGLAIVCVGRGVAKIRENARRASVVRLRHPPLPEWVCDASDVGGA
jgi:hypothetical protein